MLALWVADASAGALASAGRAAHGCEDHVCFCRKPASRPPAAPCHGGADEEAPRLTAACNHDADPATLSPTRPALLPSVLPSPASDGSRPLPRASGEAPADGFRPIASPPPRTTPVPRG
jgi:hypothetical protein